MAYNTFTIDEYELLACWMNTLAAEHHRTGIRVRYELLVCPDELLS